MRALKEAAALGFLVLFLAGCGGENENLDKEEVIQKTEDSFAELDSLKQATEIDISMEEADRSSKTDLDFDVEMIYDEEKNIESIRTKTERVQNDVTDTLDFYKGEEGTYANQGMGWQEHNAGESYASTYEPNMDAFLDVADKMEMTESETHYEMHYTGQDGNIFRSVGKPYDIKYTGIQDDDVEVDVTYMIDKETMFIEELTIGTKGEAQGTKIAIDAHTKFKDMNNVETVEAPEGL